MAESTILIVDDDHLVRWSFAERLKAEGHRVLEAATGCEALEALPRGVEVVLLDCQLPDVDGFDVLREIREFDRDGDRLDARDSGALAPRRNMRTALELPADGVDLEDLERSLVAQALARSQGNQTRAGALRGLNRDQVRYRIEKFKLPLAH